MEEWEWSGEAHSRCLYNNESLEGQNSTFSISVVLYIIRKPRKFCAKLEKQNSLALGSFFLIFGCLMSPPEGNAEFYKQKTAESSIRIQLWSKSTIAYMIDDGVQPLKTVLFQLTTSNVADWSIFSLKKSIFSYFGNLRRVELLNHNQQEGLPILFWPFITRDTLRNLHMLWDGALWCAM